MSEMSEVWKDIPGYEGRYQASTEGRIRSVDRTVDEASKAGYRRKRHIVGRELTPWISSGYYYVNLGHRDKHTVHSLVACTFLGARSGLEVCHADGVRLNNRVENLRYDTHAENLRDEYRWGRAWNTKLSPEDVRQVRKKLAAGQGCTEISRQLGVKRNVILSIKQGRSFSWVD